MPAPRKVVERKVKCYWADGDVATVVIDVEEGTDITAVENRLGAEYCKWVDE